MNDDKPSTQPPAMRLSRILPASRDVVFRAWSSADHLKQWFCPTGFSVPEAKVEFYVGGAFHICMRSPEGLDHWTVGSFVEIASPSRLVIDMNILGEGDVRLFRAYTVVNFAEEPGGATRLEVEQNYTLLEPGAAAMIRGASRGWGQTLDRLELEAARMQQSSPQKRSVVHGSFCIERTFDAPRTRVFEALTDPAAKAKWFGASGDYVVLARSMDARPGGRELLRGRWKSGLVSTFEAVYFDVVPAERIVYGYEMHLDERKISVSLTTFDLKPADDRTRLVMTEQGAYLDGYDDAGSRERGSSALLDALGNSLKT